MAAGTVTRRGLGSRGLLATRGLVATTPSIPTGITPRGGPVTRGLGLGARLVTRGFLGASSVDLGAGPPIAAVLVGDDAATPRIAGVVVRYS